LSVVNSITSMQQDATKNSYMRSCEQIQRRDILQTFFLTVRRHIAFTTGVCSGYGYLPFLTRPSQALQCRFRASSIRSRSMLLFVLIMCPVRCVHFSGKFLLYLCCTSGSDNHRVRWIMLYLLA